MTSNVQFGKLVIAEAKKAKAAVGEKEYQAAKVAISRLNRPQDFSNWPLPRDVFTKLQNAGVDSTNLSPVKLLEDGFNADVVAEITTTNTDQSETPVPMVTLVARHRNGTNFDNVRGRYFGPDWDFTGFIEIIRKTLDELKQPPQKIAPGPTTTSATEIVGKYMREVDRLLDELFEEFGL